MTNWRKILSYREEERFPQIDDEVEVIADDDLLNSIGVGSTNREESAIVRRGDTLRILHIDPNLAYESGLPEKADYYGVIDAHKIGFVGEATETFQYPYSHWKDFFRIV
jgi:hypothetical protein